MMQSPIGFKNVPVMALAVLFVSATYSKGAAA
jgi:hypothetical protein